MSASPVQASPLWNVGVRQWCWEVCEAVRKASGGAQQAEMYLLCDARRGTPTLRCCCLRLGWTLP